MSGVKIRRGSVLLDLGLVRAIRPLWIAWLLLLPAVAQAQFTFTTNNGAITITGYTGPGGVVTIPDTTNGYPVTSIGNMSFYLRTTVTGVIIPDSVTSIGFQAFYMCSGLINVKIGNSVTNIGYFAFEFCSGLHQAHFQGNAPSVNGGVGSLDSSVFAGESGTAYYVLGTTGWGATFGGWPTAVLDSSVADFTYTTSNGAITITGYIGPSDMVIPSNINGYPVTTIGYRAFLRQSYLSSVTIPSSVTSIGDEAFNQCSGLTNVIFGNSLTNIGSNVFGDCSGLTSVTIPNSVTTIGSGAFAGCSSLKYVMIPNSVTSIGDAAFAECIQLTDMNIPNSLATISGDMFSDCYSLTNVMIPNSVTSIGTNAFGYCSGLKGVTIPNSVTSISDWAFCVCSGLTNVTIPDSVTNIGAAAFDHCSSLVSVTIPNSVTTIGNQAFADCSDLVSVAIPNQVKNIGDFTFFDCSSLTNVTIPGNVTNIGNWAFYSCSGLTSVMLGDHVNAIGLGAFEDCSNLTSMTLPESVTDIGNQAFFNCTSLTNVSIPNNVNNVGNWAFSGCSNLHQAYFQGNAPGVNGGAGSADSTVFQGESGTVYYLPGTTGWGTTFGGWPTHVTQAVHESGFIKDERWNNYVVSDIINNRVPATPDYTMAVTEWGVGVDNSAVDSNFARRISGYFVPPADNYYNFHLTSDDDSILFLSTDDTPGNKVEIAAQNGWNGGARWDWGVIGGGTPANDNLMTHSDTYTTDGIGGTNYLNPGGIFLSGGHRYYIEQDMHQGGGGANVAATWSYFGDPDPAVGTETLFKGSAIQMNVNRCSYVAFTQQPQNIANAKLGSSVGFSAVGTTDSQVSIGGINGYEENYTNNFLFFQWFTNGVAIPGANSSFVLIPVTADMVGVPVMCQTRALGFTDDALNPIWTNSTTATITSVVAAPPPGLIGHFISGTADLNDSANYVAPGTYYGVPARATNSTRFYYFTNDVPYGAPTGAVSLHLNNYAIAITNTSTTDSGYVVDTFDGSMKNAFTVMCWAKGNLGSWNTFVAKGGDNGVGWALRTGDAGGRACWTVRGSGGSEDMQGPYSYGDGQWHHYAGTFDLNSTVTNVTTVTNIDVGPPAVTNVTYTTNVLVGMRSLYVDGVLVTQQIGEGAYTLNGAGHLTLGTEDLPPGNNYGYTGYINANLYDVRIYNYALTGTQILDIPNPPIPITWGAIPSFVTTNNVTYADYPWFPSCGDTVVGTGPLTRNGNTFWYDFDLEKIYGVPCPLVSPTQPAIITVTLGNLSMGVYNLITTSWGIPVATNAFTVPLVLQSAGFAGDGSFQLQLLNGITNANYVLQSSTNLLDWTSLSTNSLVPVLTDTNPVLPGPRYYRVQIFGQ